MIYSIAIRWCEVSYPKVDNLWERHATLDFITCLVTAHAQRLISVTGVIDSPMIDFLINWPNLCSKKIFLVKQFLGQGYSLQLVKKLKWNSYKIGQHDGGVILKGNPRGTRLQENKTAFQLDAYRPFANHICVSVATTRCQYWWWWGP